jgi:hypothetical protein
MALLLACPNIARARDVPVAGVQVADHATVGGQTMRLNGAGLRTLFGFQVYVAALYLPAPVREAERILEHDMPLRLQLTLLRDTTAEQNIEALKAGLSGNNSALEMDAIKSEVALFFSLIRQVREFSSGTEIQLDYLPGAGASVRIDGKGLGLIPGERFKRALLKVWLGVEPTQPSLKKALLGSDLPAL